MTDAALHRWTASDGVELAYYETGEGRPVILLHGLFSSAQMNWIKFGHADRIASEGFRVITPDLRAHGESGKPHDPAKYSADILVRDLKELIAHLKLERFDLGGFSLGARTTIDAVEQRCSAGTRDPVRHRREGPHQLGSPEQLLPRGDRPVRRGSARRSALAVDPVHAHDEGRPRSSSAPAQGARRSSDPEQALAAFTMPTLVVCGSEDHDNGSAREFAEALPNARYEEIPGTHMSSVTKPDLGEKIAEFLAAV